MPAQVEIIDMLSDAAEINKIGLLSPAATLAMNFAGGKTVKPYLDGSALMNMNVQISGKSSTKTATQRQFGISGDMYIGDEAQDFMLSHKIKYGTGQTVIVNYVFFNMLTGKGEKGKATVAVNSDGSGNSGDNAGIDIQLSKVGDAPAEFTYSAVPDDGE